MASCLFKLRLNSFRSAPLILTALCPHTVVKDLLCARDPLVCDISDKPPRLSDTRRLPAVHAEYQL